MLVRSFARSLVVKSDFHEIWHRERKTPTEVKVKLPVGTDRQTNTQSQRLITVYLLAQLENNRRLDMAI